MAPSDTLNRLLFPAPSPTYDANSFPGEIVYAPPYHGPLSGFPSEGCPSTPRDGSENAKTTTTTTTTTPPTPAISAGLRRARLGSGSWPGSASEPGRTQDPVPCLFLPYDSARFVVLYLHSNAEDLGKCRLAMNTMRAQFQVHILAVEYPGYGIAKGGPCDERKATASALAAMAFLREVLQWPLDSIIVFGRSIGCGPAISVALQHEVAGLILVSPMMSFRELCKDIAGRLPAAFVQERFPNFARMPKVASPVLIVHGKKDEVIPYRHAEELFRVCRSRKLLVAPPEMTHNSDLLSEVNYLVLPMLQFFALPDYCFMDLIVPSWAYDEPDRESIQEVEHASPDCSGRCQPPGLEACKEASTWGSTLKWILDLGLRCSEGRVGHASGLANEGPEAPLARRISMPHAVSSNIFVARPSPPPEVPEEEEEEEEEAREKEKARAKGEERGQHGEGKEGAIRDNAEVSNLSSHSDIQTTAAATRETTKKMKTEHEHPLTIVADADAGAGAGAGTGQGRARAGSSGKSPVTPQAWGKSPYSSEGTTTSHAPLEAEDGIAAPRASKEFRFAEDRSSSNQNRQSLIARSGLQLPRSQGRTASRNKLQEVDGLVAVPVSQHLCVEECELLEEEEVPEITTRSCLGTCSQAGNPPRKLGLDGSSCTARLGERMESSAKAAAAAAAAATWAAAATSSATATATVSASATATATATATAAGAAQTPQILRCTLGAEPDKFRPLNIRDRQQLDMYSSLHQQHHQQLRPQDAPADCCHEEAAGAAQFPAGHPFQHQQHQHQPPSPQEPGIVPGPRRRRNVEPL